MWIEPTDVNVVGICCFDTSRLGPGDIPVRMKEQWATFAPVQGRITQPAT
jgi:hypothetical protein